MTMQIKVTVPEEMVKANYSVTYLDQAMAAIGYSRGVSLALPEKTQDETGTSDAANTELADDAVATNTATDEAAPTRQRGKPSPGKSRRTKAEIAEDEAAEAADTQQGISTGDERIDPTSKEDAAQDAKDEADEQAETSSGDLSHDSVRGALKAYVTAYGLAAAMEDGPKVLALMFGDDCIKISDVPETQEDLAKAISGFAEMTEKNPYKRDLDV